MYQGGRRVGSSGKKMAISDIYFIFYCKLLDKSLKGAFFLVLSLIFPPALPLMAYAGLCEYFFLKKNPFVRAIFLLPFISQVLRE